LPMILSENPFPRKYSRLEEFALSSSPADCVLSGMLRAASFRVSSLSEKAAAFESRDGRKAPESRKGSERTLSLCPRRTMAPRSKGLRFSAAWSRCHPAIG
jgi:hypothetical protein